MAPTAPADTVKLGAAPEPVNVSPALVELVGAYGC